MRIALYEWCCSGGLAGDVAGAELDVFAREGRIMLEALARDAARDGRLDVTLLVDTTQPVDVPPSVRVRPVPAGTEVEMLVAAACAADWALIVAPETDGLLAARVAAVRAAGGRVLASSATFLAIAADKQATVNALAAAGLPVPAGRSLAPGNSVPAGFRMPAVLKARASAGCDGLRFLTTVPPTPVGHDARLEAFAPGTPVGVSCICGTDGVAVLPPLKQRFSSDEGGRYLGSEPLDDARARERAASLARRSVAAVTRAADGTPALGWVGVDMILGAREDGRDDRVLEINPRLTTSFMAQSHATSTSLVRSMLDHASRTRNDLSRP